jgi:hypothetical protein
VPWHHHLLAPPCSPCHCSLLPPHKQLLTAGFRVLLWPWWVLTWLLSSSSFAGHRCCPPFSTHCHCPHLRSTQDPSHKQLLIGLDMGGVSFIIVVHGWGCGAILVAVGPWCSVSVTWLTYGGCWMLTGRVSPFWGLLASLCTLLTASHPV